MTISRLTQLTPEIETRLLQLLVQLNSNLTATRQLLHETLAQPNIFVFVAQNENQILGMLTLVHYPLFSGHKAWIEDVVVDNTARGKGIGKMLVENAIFFAKQQRWKKIDLTSHTERIAANILYRNIGFQQRDTNVYRLETANYKQ